MAVLDQLITDRFAVYNGDCIETMRSLPDKSVHLSIHSPPFVGLYVYSSSERDLSNARSYHEFFVHYEFVVREIHRLTLPGRLSGVHVMDVPTDGANLGGGLIDFPGDVIRLHQRLGFHYVGRYCVWKEPLAVRNKTMMKSLAHKQVVDDSSLCDNASADYLLMFRKRGTNPIPIAHPTGLTEYAGERPIPPELLPYRNWKGKQTENRYSHWIWRQYASAFWDDVRIGRVLPYKEARDSEDEKHLHPLQLDVIDRCLTLWSNPGETVLSPFMGVGSEIYSAVRMGRKAIGIELKPSYYRQAIRNLETVEEPVEQRTFFDLIDAGPPAVPESDPEPGTMDDPAPAPIPEVAVDVNSQDGNPADAPVVDPGPMPDSLRNPDPPGPDANWPGLDDSLISNPSAFLEACRDARGGPSIANQGLPSVIGNSDGVASASGKPPKPRRSRKPREAPSAIADVARAMFPPPDSGPVPDDSRIVWTDRDGSEWRGLHRFTVGELASITLDEVSPGVPVCRFLRVDPATIRAESPEPMEVTS